MASERVASADGSDAGSSVTPIGGSDDAQFYVSVGDVVAEKYCIERILGVGGMGFVVSAKHLQLDEHFALKFLNKEFLKQKSVAERFTREAKAACRIRSEHVARVYDVGVHEGAPFLVMEHLIGRDLATVLADRGWLQLEEAVEYTMHACEALAAAHSHGIVHRDIKPENLFLVEHEGLPVVKLLDFGISKVALTAGESDRDRAHLTGKLTLGTPCYMSPEQIRSTTSADAQSDLWSLGVVLYELLTGAAAFQADTVTEVCAAVLEQEPRPIRDIRRDVPVELADVVQRCLEKNAEKRFANVAELAVALLSFAPTRALAAAERAASVLRTPRPALGDADPITGYRSSSAIRLAHERPSHGAPLSGAPLVRSVVPSGNLILATPPMGHMPEGAKRPRRRWGALAIVAAGVALAVGNVAAYRVYGGRALVPPPSVVAAPPPETAAIVAPPLVTASPTTAPSAVPITTLPRLAPNSIPTQPAGIVRAAPRAASPRTNAPPPRSSATSSAAPPVEAPGAQGSADAPKPARLDIGY